MKAELFVAVVVFLLLCVLVQALGKRGVITSFWEHGLVIGVAVGFGYYLGRRDLIG